MRKVARSAAFTFLVLFLVEPAISPFAQAHDTAPPPSQDPGGFYVPPQSATTAVTGGPKEDFYTYYQGGYLYGRSTVSVIGDQYIADLSASGDWLAWTDLKHNQIFVYNLPSQDGYYLPHGIGIQYYPKVSGDVVVWEDRRSGISDVYAYFLDTGEQRRITNGPGQSNHKSPAIDGNLIAWEDDRNLDQDIYAYNLENHTEFRVSGDGSRDSDPLVIGGTIYWRAFRFGVWDIAYFDTITGTSGYVTADRAMEQAPLSDGTAPVFLKEAPDGWNAWRYDPVLGLASNTGVRVLADGAFAASGDHLIHTQWDTAKASLLATNLSSGYTARITGYLPVMDAPASVRDKVFIPVWNGTKAAILTFDVSPFAYVRPPRLSLDTPEDLTTVFGKTRFAGKIVWSDGAVATAPTTFAESVNGENVTALRMSDDGSYAFTLDFTNRAPGRYDVQVEAHFQDLPTIVQRITVIVATSTSTLDLDQVGPAYYHALVFGLIHFFTWNPALDFLILLAFTIVALWVVRWRLRRAPVQRSEVEYVSVDDEA